MNEKKTTKHKKQRPGLDGTLAKIITWITRTTNKELYNPCHKSSVLHAKSQHDERTHAPANARSSTDRLMSVFVTMN